MNEFIDWLVYVLTGVFIIVMAGAGIGLFLGVVLSWVALAILFIMFYLDKME